MKRVSPIDLVFEAYRDIYKLTTEQFDAILNKVSDEEMETLIISSESSFSDKRKALAIINKYTS